MDAAQLIIEGKGYLGIEFGSTRIKAVLVDKSGNVLASGGHSWENRYEDGVWRLMRMIPFWFRSVPGEIRLQRKQLQSLLQNLTITFRRDGALHIFIRQS